VNPPSHFHIDWHTLLTENERVDPGCTARPPTNGTVSFGVLHGLAMTAAVGLNRPPVFVEIGTFGGGSLRVLCRVAQLTGGHVYSMDPDEAYVRRGTIPALEREGWAPYWTYLPGCSEDIAPMEADLLYVDGDHSYPAVCSDLARHGMAVREGGIGGDSICPPARKVGLTGPCQSALAGAPGVAYVAA
jgi:hypothetical protein